MEGEDWVFTQRTTKKRPRTEKKAEERVVKAGPFTSVAKSTPSPTATPTLAPPKHLAVETTRAAGCAEGELNPRGTEDKEKRKSVTATSTAREDQAFQPVPWECVPRVVEMEVDDEEARRRVRDERGIVIRELGEGEQLGEEFKIRYTTSSDATLGKTMKDEGVDKIKKTILRLAGLAPETISADLDVYEASPEPILTQEEQGLTAGQRETLFKEIFARGGRVAVDDKPGLCTEPKCYRYRYTLSSDVLPKCPIHLPEPLYTVMTVTDYKRRDVLVQLHFKKALFVGHDASDKKKDEEAELVLGQRAASYQSWKEYCGSQISTLSTKGLKGKAKKVEDDKNRPIAKSIDRFHFTNEEEALKKLAFESTICMFMKLAPGTQAIINLDDLIPLCYGMEGQIDARLKERGMVLKIRRHLKPEERVKVKSPFPGEYLLGTAAAELQKPEKGKTFLYAIMSRDMHYFGWSETPDFKGRLDVSRTDGASEYKKITVARAKSEGVEPPTLTCYLLAKCDDDDKKKIKTKTIEAKMIIAGYVAYLLGFYNPIVPRFSPCYSTNKCVSISLIDSSSWAEICDFVKLFWGFEPMLGRFEGN
ncbi:uncharacterized protein LOC110853544 isoform X2 [Folsomia candida]|uniref:uncharacterized protein LOC110853544 isoform X2 n=1 Tax=Folsomia candida TaxID=158441 RepID=UPI00160534AF|nr:uncharacterized protein LOC110853544 isoform X2 [Folsomia candida]